MKGQNYAAISEHAHLDGVYPFPAVMQTRTIETNGTSIHVRVGGNGPEVVMLHGFGTTGDMWGHLASALIEDHMIVVPDLRGLGLSSKPDGGYDKKNQAADVLGVMDALGVRSAELVTHDIGIMVGFALAASHPERVNRWVAIDAPLPGVGPWDQIRLDPAMWHFGFGGKDMERLVAGRERIYLDRFWNELSRDPKRFDEAKRQHYAALYARPGAMRASFAQFRAFSQDATDNRTFSAQGKLQMPVLALGGEATFGPLIGAVIRGVAENVEDVTIPDCGHWITEEQPAETTKLIVDFLHRRNAESHVKPHADDATAMQQLPTASAEQRLKELGIKLPAPPDPFGTYAEAVQTGNLLFLTGMLPTEARAAKFVGRLGAEVNVEAGRAAARLAALNGLAVARQHLGSLDKVTRVVRLGVHMATSGDFREQPKLADAASELLQDVFGKDKNPCRLVYGVASLPLGTPVELEIIFEVAG
jgi:pimeloyl-ACP methyl ester carboxylesterase/enamine deaminase RidA (YjgF/YER057c/UK114 family)